jgi:exonuclease SbcC
MFPIKNLVLKNFEAHKHSELNLSEGLNVIRGCTDNGKSSVARALEWVLTNKPKGTEFISTFKKKKEDCSVEIHGSDDAYLKRLRGTKNILIFGDEELEAFKDQYPLPDFSLNIHSQDSSWFLLGQSPSVIGEILGKFSGISEYNEAIEFITNKKKKTEQRKEFLVSSIEKNAARQKKTDEIIRDTQSLTDELDSLYKQAEIIESQINLLNEAVFCYTAIQKSDLILYCEKYFEECQNLFAELRNIEQKLNVLDSILDEYHRLSESELSVTRILNLKPSYEFAVKYQNSIKEIEERVGILNQYLYEGTAAEKKIQAVDSDIKRYKSELVEYEVCPLCGNKMGGSAVW